jgi:arylsulfatase A-like enzyme
VPLVVRGPGFDGGNRVESLVSLVDLPPTLLDAANIDPPESMEGDSAMDLVATERSPTTVEHEWDEEVFIQISEAEVGRALRTERWKYSVYAPESDRWEDAASEHYVEHCLYDLAADPYEQVNLAGRPEYDDVAERLRE